MSLLGIIVFGLMCLGAASASAQEALWKTYREAGEKAYEEDRYQTAGIMFAAAKAEAELFGPDDPRLASTLNQLANVFYDEKQQEKAQPLYTRALVIWDAAGSTPSIDLSECLTHLAIIKENQTQRQDAQRLYERALAVREKLHGAEDTKLIVPLTYLAQNLRAQKHHREAGLQYERALAIQEKHLGPDHADVAMALFELAQYYSEQDGLGKAEPLFDKAIAILEKQTDTGGTTLPAVLGEAAAYYYREKKLKKARDLVGREIVLREKLEASEELATALGYMGLACSELGDHTEAESFYKRALAVRKKIGKDQDPRNLWVLQHYAEILRKLNRDTEASTIEAQMEEIRANAAARQTKP